MRPVPINGFGTYLKPTEMERKEKKWNKIEKDEEEEKRRAK